VVPTADGREVAARLLTTIGLRPEPEDGTLYFRVPDSLRLHDAEFVRHALDEPTGREMRWQVDGTGTFRCL
jgi:hypothetical protein